MPVILPVTVLVELSMPAQASQDTSHRSPNFDKYPNSIAVSQFGRLYGVANAV